MIGKFIILFRQNTPHRIASMEPVVYRVDGLLGKHKLVVCPVVGDEVVKRKQSMIGDHIAFIGDSEYAAVQVVKEIQVLEANIRNMEQCAADAIDMFRSKDKL